MSFFAGFRRLSAQNAELKVCFLNLFLLTNFQIFPFLSSHLPQFSIITKR